MGFYQAQMQELGHSVVVFNLENLCICSERTGALLWQAHPTQGACGFVAEKCLWSCPILSWKRPSAGLFRVHRSAMTSAEILGLEGRRHLHAHARWATNCMLARQQQLSLRSQDHGIAYRRRREHVCRCVLRDAIESAHQSAARGARDN
jgi:hypothetical protein